MKRVYLAAAGLAALSTAAPAAAQQAPEPDVAGRAGASAVSEVVVTATRTPQPIERIGAAVTVLTKAEIEASQAVTAIDLLAATPALNYVRNGGPGTAATVNIRGAEGQHTVVLIDGVKLNDPASTQGAFNFGNLLIGDVARVEVLRGAHSTLWGSQAVGGVVNIVTARPEAPFEAGAEVEGGSRGTGYVRAGVGGAGERYEWRLAGGHYTTEGFSALASGTEDDGYDNTGASGRVRLDLSDTFGVEARAVYSNGRAEFDAFNGDSDEYGTTKELVAYAGASLALFEGRLKNRLGYAFTDTDRENYNPAAAPFDLSFEADGENRRWEYQGAFALAQGWDATFGLERETAEMRTRSPSSFDPDPAFVIGEAEVDSAYLLIQGEVLPGLTLTGGVRGDEHDTYGGHTTGQAAAAWALNGGATVLRASFGQGFRAPGLYELFSEYGNLDLEPESFDAWEAGVEQAFLDGALRLSATAFRREADNEIRYNSCSPGTTDPLCTPGGVARWGYYRNVQATETQGVELAGDARLGERLTLVGNYTYTEAEFASGANAGNRLVRRPEHLANLSATYRWPGGLSTTAALRHVGEAFANDANTTVTPDYTLVDLRAAYPVREGLEVYGRVENLFDQDYETVRGYGAAGRGAFVGLRARF